MEAGKVFMAQGVQAKFVAHTPRAAAEGFFKANPTKRKCDIIEGSQDGSGFFTIAFSAHSRPRQWKDVTKSVASTLPDDGVQHV